MKKEGLPPKKLRCVLFDLDGTLLDTVDLIYRSFDHAVKSVLGLKLPKGRLLENMGRPLMTQMQAFSADRAEELVDAYNEHNLTHHDRHIAAYPEAKSTLEWLKKEKRRRIGVVTSKKRQLSIRGLSATGLLPFIDVIVAMEDTAYHKPDPEPILVALRKLDCQPAQAAMIGDSPFDLTAGKHAGVATAAALWGPFDAGILKASQPDAVLEDFAAVRAWLT